VHRIAAALLLAVGLAAPQDGPRERLHKLLAAHREATTIRSGQRQDLSESGFRTREARHRATLEALEGIPRRSLGGDDRTLYDLVVWDLERRLERFRLRMYLMPFWGDPDLPPPDGDAAHIRQLIALLRQGIQARMLPSRSTVRELVSSVEGMASDAQPLRELQTFLASEYVPACPEQVNFAAWPNGAEVYRELVRRTTTTTMEPAEVHELGLREVARIREAIRQEAGGKDISRFLAEIHADGRFYFRKPEQLLAAWRAAAARIAPLVPKVVSTPATPFRIEPAEHGGPAGVYNPSGEPPTIWVEVSKLNIRPSFEIVPTLLHEGVPGHHLQLTLELRREFDLLRKSEAFNEGWALYAESLGEEMGLYGDRDARLGRLSMDLMRAVRLVVDTGIHAYGWSPERARTYFVEQTGKSLELAALEVSRSLRPGVSLAYKVGELRIRALRERAARKLGERFDLRSFNDTILRWGPLPLAVLEKKTEECLQEQACAATFAH
jgi:uncharacterized protein (DUF885 family)